MPNELLPCPACLGNDVFVMEEFDSGLFWVECDSPDCSLHGPVRNSKESAISTWNALPRAPHWIYYDGTEATLPPIGKAVLVKLMGINTPRVCKNTGNYNWKTVIGRTFEAICKGDLWMLLPEIGDK